MLTTGNADADRVLAGLVLAHKGLVPLPDLEAAVRRDLAGKSDLEIKAAIAAIKRVLADASARR